MEFENEFDAVILIYCDYAALIKEERKVLLKNIKRALKPNGLFIFDVFSTSSLKNEESPSSWASYENGGYWSDKPHICLEAIHKFEENTIAVNQYIVITGAEIKEYLIWNTMYDLESLTAEIAESGFSVKEAFDDVCGLPYTGKSGTICLVSRCE